MRERERGGGRERERGREREGERERGKEREKWRGREGEREREKMEKERGDRRWERVKYERYKLFTFKLKYHLNSQQWMANSRYTSPPAGNLLLSPDYELTQSTITWLNKY